MYLNLVIEGNSAYDASKSNDQKMVRTLKRFWEVEEYGVEDNLRINPLNDDNKYTANGICKMIEFLVDNIYVRFDGQLF